MSSRSHLPPGVWLFLTAAWGLFLVVMYWSGALTRTFQTEPYNYFTGAAGLVLLVLSIKMAFWPAPHGDDVAVHECSLEPSPLGGHCACGEEHEETVDDNCGCGHDHGHESERATAGLVPPCDCGHDHGEQPANDTPAYPFGKLRASQRGLVTATATNNPRRAWVFVKVGLLLAVLAAPLLFGLLVPRNALNSLAAERRGIAMDPADILAAYHSQHQKVAEMEGDYRKLNTLEIIEQACAPRAADAPPLKVSTVALVSRRGDMPADFFQAIRFRMTCCAADAVPIQVLVRWPQAAKLVDDTWVRILGTVRKETIGGRPVVVITAEVVQPLNEAPARPYI